MPDFTLPSENGARVRISDYRGKRSLVLIFAGRGESEAARRLLAQFAGLRAEFANEEAQLLGIVRGDQDQAARLAQDTALPFPLLADSDGRVHRRVGAEEEIGAAAVFVTDRYGEVRHVFRGGELPPNASGWAREVLEWVRYANLECPE